MKDIKQFIVNLKKYYRYSYREASAELRTEVADSYLNWLWWILNPLCFMTIYTIVFGYIFEAKEEYFIAFVLVGITVWDYFNRMLTSSVTLIVQKRDLISKTYIPKYILLISKSFVYLFKFFISMGLLLIIMILFGVPFTLKAFYFIPILIIFYTVTLGFSMILMHFGVFVQDLSNAIGIILRFIFYLSGVFYNINMRIENPIIQYIILRCNPMAFIMSEFRKVLIYGQDPSFEGLAVWFGIGILLCIIGIRMINKNENSYAKVI